MLARQRCSEDGLQIISQTPLGGLLPLVFWGCRNLDSPQLTKSASSNSFLPKAFFGPFIELGRKDFSKKWKPLSFDCRLKGWQL